MTTNDKKEEEKGGKARPAIFTPFRKRIPYDPKELERLNQVLEMIKGKAKEQKKEPK